MPRNPSFARLTREFVVEVDSEFFVSYYEGLIIHDAVGSNGLRRGVGGFLDNLTFFLHMVNPSPCFICEVIFCHPSFPAGIIIISIMFDFSYE